MSNSITIQGLVFPHEPTYAAGHVCTEAEAQALNAVHAENLRNNFSRRIIKACEEHSVANATALPSEAKSGLAAEFDAYAKAYRIGLRTPQKIDPIGVLAHKLAREAVLKKLRSLDIDPKSLPQDKVEANVASALAHNAWFKEEAERRVSALREVAAQLVQIEV